ncbi:Os03g0586033 [Oryza sativa Japonica Group]|uniref:Os03g0586033 protein n=1 Tax=Oryza sativa subsp. japonica TaxID=39947 RepID=A0A0P0W0F8_ORYSJ|nr:Os03g0586033 [Oryza sativa Japonica Group]
MARWRRPVRRRGRCLIAVAWVGGRPGSTVDGALGRRRSGAGWGGSRRCRWLDSAETSAPVEEKAVVHPDVAVEAVRRGGGGTTLAGDGQSSSPGPAARVSASSTPQTPAAPLPSPPLSRRWRPRPCSYKRRCVWDETPPLRGCCAR